MSDRFAAANGTGHWLDLEHVFYRGCSNWAISSRTRRLRRSPREAVRWVRTRVHLRGLDSIHNYMDYSYDTRHTEFTKGQARRMRDAWLFSRAYRKRSGG